MDIFRRLVQTFGQLFLTQHLVTLMVDNDSRVALRSTQKMAGKMIFRAAVAAHFFSGNGKLRLIRPSAGADVVADVSNL